MTKRVRSIVLAGVSASAILLAGCAGGDTDSPEQTDGAGGTITFSGQTQEQDLWEALFEEFEAANPGYTVDATYSPNDSYVQLVQTQLQAGQAADVIQTTPGTGGGLAALSLAEGGRLAPLDGMAWVDSLPDSTEPLVSLDGEVYAYPTDLAPFFVAYNPDLFEQVGAEVPTTFDELLETCGTVADAGLIPIAVAGASFNNVNITIQALAANNVFGPNPEWNEERESGETTFADSPEWHDALADFQSMIDAGCYSVDAAGVQAPVHYQQYGSHQAAMTIIPAQGLSIVEANATGDLKTSSFPLPAHDADDTRVPGTSGVSLVINAKAADPDAARKLIEFLGTPDQRIVYAEHAGTIAWAAGPDGADVVPEVLEPLEPYLGPEQSQTLYYLFWPSGVSQQLATSAQGLLTGQKTIDQVLADADQAWDSASQ